MSRFAILVLACMLQNVYSQCIGAGWPAAAIGAPCGYGAELAGPLGLGIAGPAALGYGPTGTYGYGAEIAAPLGLAAPGYGIGLAAGPAYGGTGIGEVAVAGELGVSGITTVAGQVPILGSVEFGGLVPAAGSVTITGSCACGCGGPYLY